MWISFGYTLVLQRADCFYLRLQYCHRRATLKPSSIYNAGLYRVVNGMYVFDPKLKIVSPGADSSIYHPFADEERHGSIGKLVFSPEQTDEHL